MGIWVKLQIQKHKHMLILPKEIVFQKSSSTSLTLSMKIKAPMVHIAKCEKVPTNKEASVQRLSYDHTSMLVKEISLSL